MTAIKLNHYYYGSRWLYCEGRPELLFTENETNAQRLFGLANESPYVKDGINDYSFTAPSRRSIRRRPAPKPRRIIR